MYKWQTDGIISWRDGYYNAHPDLPLSVSTTEWDDVYTAFSGSWSLFGIVKGILDLIAAIPTGRYWLDPVDNDSLTEPAAVVTGARYLIPGTATAGANWLVDGPAGGPVQDCIAECTAGSVPGPVAWEYYGDPAVWGGAQDHDLDDGASVWNLYEDSYWVYDATGAAWIQCGGSTLEKVEEVGSVGVFLINNTTHRGTTFVVKQSGGTATLVLPAPQDGLIYRVLRDTLTGSTNHVDIAIAAGQEKPLFLQQRQYVLDAGGTPIYLDQTYRKLRLISRGDSVYILGTKDGWVIVDGLATFRDVSPQDAGTAQAVGDATHITLQAGASADNHEYEGRLIFITACTGVPAAVGQIRLITGYAGATKVATISPAWTVNPDDTAVYDMVRYDALSIGMAEIGSCYSQNDMDAYDPVGGALDSNNFPTISRYAGLNTTETWGALLLGRAQRALAGAKFATVFGENSYARWDNQMVFGCSPEQSAGIAQVSRIIMSGSVSGNGGVKALALGSGNGETDFVTEVDKVYYVTFSITAHVSPSGGTIPKYISWSGSFLAKNDPDDSDLEIIAGSKNITETANEGSPALSLDITVSGTDIIEFQATNAETDPNCIAIFIGFADVIEHKLTHSVA
jgi:hypothetical protein